MQSSMDRYFRIILNYCENLNPLRYQERCLFHLYKTKYIQMLHICLYSLGTINCYQSGKQNTQKEDNSHPW